jgi:hypothetical protein
MNRRWFGVGWILFLLALAVVIGLRMSSEAMAVVIGVIFGVAASIPASLLIVAVTWRREQRATHYYGTRRRSAHEALPPSVVIVNPGGAGSDHVYRPPAYLPQPEMQWDQPPRQFRVIGDPDEVSLDKGHVL